MSVRHFGGEGARASSRALTDFGSSSLTRELQYLRATRVSLGFRTYVGFGLVPGPKWCGGVREVCGLLGPGVKGE